MIRNDHRQFYKNNALVGSLHQALGGKITLSIDNHGDSITMGTYN
jgi:hypothetical protein